MGSIPTCSALEVRQWTFSFRTVWLVNKSARQPQFRHIQAHANKSVTDLLGASFVASGPQSSLFRTIWFVHNRMVSNPFGRCSSVTESPQPNRYNCKRKLHFDVERASLITNSGTDSHKIRVKSDMERTCLQGPNLSSYEDSTLTYAVVLLQLLVGSVGVLPCK